MAKSLDIIHPEKEDETPVFEPKQEEQMVIEEPKEGNGSFYLVLGIVAIVLAVAISMYILFKDNSNDKDNVAAVDSVTATEEETQTETVTVEESPTATATQTASVVTDGDVRIANGNGISGEGKRISELLKTAGYNIALVNNASKTYTETIIYYKTGQEALAESLKNSLDEEYTATIQKSDSIVGVYDAVVALGSK